MSTQHCVSPKTAKIQTNKIQTHKIQTHKIQLHQIQTHKIQTHKIQTYAYLRQGMHIKTFDMDVILRQDKQGCDPTHA